jgi:hypothetical protein
MSKFFAVYQRKRRKARFWRKPLGWIAIAFYLSTNINMSTDGTKGQQIKDEKDRGRIFDLKTLVFIFFFFSSMFLYASWGCNGRGEIEH